MLVEVSDNGPSDSSHNLCNPQAKVTPYFTLHLLHINLLSHIPHVNSIQEENPMAMIKNLDIKNK